MVGRICAGLCQTVANCGPNASQTPPNFAHPRLTPSSLLTSASMRQHMDRSLGSEAWLRSELQHTTTKTYFISVVPCCSHASWSNDTYNNQAERLTLVVGPNSAHWSTLHGMRALCRRRMSPLCPSWGWPCALLTYPCSPKLSVLCVWDMQKMIG